MSGPTWALCLLIAVVIGAIPATIAESKGRRFIAWWFLGAALFIVALPASLLIKAEGRRQPGHCPFCGTAVSPEAELCSFCGRDLPADRVKLEGTATNPSNPAWCGRCVV